MKSAIMFIVLLVLSCQSFAARKDITGVIGKVRYHVDNGALAPTWNKTVWFELNNPSQSFCGNNRVSIPQGNESAISIMLAAKMADKKIEITIDDSIKYPAGHTYCALQYITIL